MSYCQNCADLERQLRVAEKSEDELHTAICIATGMMNMGDNAPAHVILRKALMAYQATPPATKARTD